VHRRGPEERPYCGRCGAEQEGVRYVRVAPSGASEGESA